MALQASGQIKFSEINTELGRGATLKHGLTEGMEGSYGVINTLNDAANRPDGTEPHRISEWYSYNHSLSNSYWLFGSDAQRLGFGRTSGPTQSTGDLTISMWVRPDWAASDTNTMLMMLSPDATSTNDRVFFMYDYGLHRIICRERSNGVNTRGTHFNLTSNSSQTGISSGNWHGTNRGNVNGDDFCHIVFTLDSSASTGATAFDMYWNGVKLPNKLTNLTGTRTNFNMESIYINGSNNGTGNSRKSAYDNVIVWNDRLLSQTEITSLYNSGVPQTAGEASLSTDMIFEFDAESDPPVATPPKIGSDTTYSNIIDSGVQTSY